MKRLDCCLLLAFGFANAVLYSSLLPLWEGFDEPFHYGYVQYLDTMHQLPVLTKTRLSEEVWRSLLACPVSHIVQRGLPQAQTYDRYFEMSPAARSAERRSLEGISGGRDLASVQDNYEAQQAPLAYAILSGPDLLLSRFSIPSRILWLRIFIAVTSLLGTFFAASSLFRTLELPAGYQVLGIFCVFACQMYWATVAHVANDGFALPLTIWFFAEVARFSKCPEMSGAVRLSLTVSLGLLTKAYFLPLSIFAAGLVAFRYLRGLPRFIGIAGLIAGPWYLRNLILYRNLSGVIASAGITPGQTAISLTQVDWSRAIPYMLRATLWTGNYSFTSFSSATLNCLLGLLAAGVIMYLASALRRRFLCDAEWGVLGAGAIYAAAIAYVVGNDVVFTRGTSAGAAPWYTIVLLVPVLSIVLLGLSRTRRAGLPVAIVTGLMWAYICAATYLVKLIPLYGGYMKGRNTLKETLTWYVSSHRDLTSMLSTISLAPPFMIYFETGIVVVLAFALASRIAILLWRLPYGPITPVRIQPH